MHRLFVALALVCLSAIPVSAGYRGYDGERYWQGQSNTNSEWERYQHAMRDRHQERYAQRQGDEQEWRPRHRHHDADDGGYWRRHRTSDHRDRDGWSSRHHHRYGGERYRDDVWYPHHRRYSGTRSWERDWYPRHHHRTSGYRSRHSYWDRRVEHYHIWYPEGARVGCYRYHDGWWTDLCGIRSWTTVRDYVSYGYGHRHERPWGYSDYRYR